MKKRTRKHWYMAAGMAAAISFCMSGCGHKTETEQRLEKSSVTAETEADGIEQQETEKDTQAQKKERPKTPYGVKISDISDAGIEVYWKGNEPWYEIYRSYEEDGTYELIADTGQIRKTPQKSSHGTYYDTEFDESRRTVYYKVRCYQYDEQKEKVYSKFSKVMTANYREQMKLNLSRMYVPSDVTRSLIAYYGWGNVQDAVWKSDAPQIAEVDADGNVTGISAGSCNITCSSESIQTELSCHIVVDRAPEPPLKEIDAEYEQISPGYWEKKNPDKTDEALIMLVGDLMCTSAQQRVDIDENGSYNFNESFTYVKDIISSADFATGNLETLLSSSWPYMKEEVYVDGKPNCNAPARYLDALIDAGFDAVMMANNHNADGGVRGTIETAQVVDQYQLMRAGSFASAEDPRTLLVDINGIKTGFLSYSPSYPGYNAKDVNWTQEEKDTYLNYYSQEKAEQEVRALREAGAEYIIVYIHWGVKNVAEIGDEERQYAQELADMGVDYIVGGHSHLIQELTEITAADGKKVPCLYSLGDFNTSLNQIPGNRDSIILQLTLRRNAEGKIELAESTYIPCYTYTEHKEMDFVTIPLDPSLNGGKNLKQYDKFHSRIVKAVGDRMEEYVPSEEVQQ